MRLPSYLVPPDGGWGWAVVFGTALINTFNQSIVSIFGLLYGEKLTDMGLNTFDSSWVATVNLLVINFSGIISGPALKKFSPRQVALVGTILSALGLIGSAFGTSLWHFIVTYSILTGLGLGLIQPSTFLAVNSYFTTKKGMAVGISMAGTGIGQFMMPQIVSALLDSYGFTGTSLILGALAFNGIIGAILFQPVSYYMKTKEGEETKMLMDSDELDENKNLTKYGSMKIQRQESITESIAVVEDMTVSIPMDSVHRYEDRNGSVSIVVINSEKIDALAKKQKKVNILVKIKEIFDLDLLKSASFINIMVACCLGTTSNQSFNMFFPIYLQQELHLDRTQAASCMSAIAFADIVGRIALPTLADRYKIKSRNTYTLSCVCLALCRTVLCNQTQYIYILIASASCGIFRAVVVVNQNLIVSEYCKDNEEKLPAALGLNMVMKGISVISLGQVLGMMRDVTQSYVATIYAQNSLLVLVFALWTPEALYKYLHKEKG